jgi:hypothetical protein
VQEHGKDPRIVAGVDGSASSVSAPRWAIRQAGLTGCTVDAVMAWHYPVATGGYGWAPVSMEMGYDLKEISEKTLVDAIGNALDPASDVRVRARSSRATPPGCCSMPQPARDRLARRRA